MQPVRLVLLLLDGSRQGENDFLEFASLDEALVYARELYGEPRFQLDGVEDLNGRSILCFDHLNELCRAPQPAPRRRYG